jgi:hypothetical protein
MQLKVVEFSFLPLLLLYWLPHVCTFPPCFTSGLTNILPIVFEAFMAVNILNVLFSLKCYTHGHYFLKSSANLHFLFYLSVSLSVILTPPNFLLFKNHVLVLV